METGILVGREASRLYCFTDVAVTQQQYSLEGSQWFSKAAFSKKSYCLFCSSLRIFSNWIKFQMTPIYKVLKLL